MNAVRTAFTLSITVPRRRARLSVSVPCKTCAANPSQQGASRWQANASQCGVVSRRVLLASAAATAAFPLLNQRSVLAGVEKLQKYTLASVGASINFPSRWFVSEKSGEVVVGDLGAVIVCVLGPVPSGVDLKGGREADIALGVLAGRQREGASIYIKDASLVNESELSFSFDTEVAMPNGDVIVRKGIGRILDGEETVAVVLTAPQEKWEANKPTCQAVVDSLVLR